MADRLASLAWFWLPVRLEEAQECLVGTRFEGSKRLAWVCQFLALPSHRVNLSREAEELEAMLLTHISPVGVRETPVRPE